MSSYVKGHCAIILSNQGSIGYLRVGPQDVRHNIVVQSTPLRVATDHGR